ncbi:HNH endonuclease signature motif containing protein [Williamsia maris]|uniref:DUF222 domain-containing protein n=1 Tax=Williamsia maris TaxID=72806 RepID=A0ABT1HES2_9NOCA|nr:HNH endonuclease signature motif containing protein [Williamsia maris]MCP2176740.1 protein of unknown function (DUF222) [Williamsia maris]
MDVTQVETAVALQSFLRSLADQPSAESEAEAIERIALLESIKAGCAAAQARDTMRFEELRIEAETGSGVPAARRGRGMASEIALARKVSGAQGSRHLGFARALMHEMPNTRAALESGALSEWRATILVRETAYLTRVDREEIDRRLCSDPTTLDGLGDRAVDAAAKKLAYELDARAVVDRHANAEKDRRVSTRPAPDGMVRLTALLPLKQGISVYASLKKHADTIRGVDDRSHAQIMADTLVERATGATSAEAMPVAVNLLLPDSILSGSDDAAALVNGYGPIPAATARHMIRSSIDAEAMVALRRVYATPTTGALVAMDSKSRTFPSGLRTLLDSRDHDCRIPYCDAPIAEYDHADPHADGGTTSEVNGLGMCLGHNRAKQNPGWFVVIGDVDIGRHTATVTTPTGHTHTSTAPPPPGHSDPAFSQIEYRLTTLLAA